MHLSVQIRCDNAAFDDEPAEEIARILAQVIKQIHNRGTTDGPYLRTTRPCDGTFTEPDRTPPISP